MTRYYPITPNLHTLYKPHFTLFKLHPHFSLSPCAFHELLRYNTFLDHIMNYSAHVCLLVINPLYFVVIPQFVNCLSTPTIELLHLHLTLCNFSANILHPKTNSDLSI